MPKVLKITKMCFECRVKNGYEGRDNGAHTACLGTCEECGEIKSILPDRHWVPKGINNGNRTV